MCYKCFVNCSVGSAYMCGCVNIYIYICIYIWWYWSIADQRHALLLKVASVREVVLGAPLRVILKHLARRTVAPDLSPLVALVHRPNESFFLVPQVYILDSNFYYFGSLFFGILNALSWYIFFCYLGNIMLFVFIWNGNFFNAKFWLLLAIFY